MKKYRIPSSVVKPFGFYDANPPIPPLAVLAKRPKISNDLLYARERLALSNPYSEAFRFIRCNTPGQLFRHSAALHFLRIALMGREESAACLPQPADASMTEAELPVERPARHPSSPLSLRCRKTCPMGREELEDCRTPLSLRASNLQPFISSLRSRRMRRWVLQSDIGGTPASLTRFARMFHSGVETAPCGRRLDLIH